MTQWNEYAEGMERLTDECADLNTRLIKILPPDLHFLIWSSPISVRNPEISIFWHPIHNKRTILSRLFAYSFSLVFSCTRGFYKFFRYKGFYYCHINNDSPALLIIPENITDGANDFKTNYLTETAGLPVDKLVFSHSTRRLKKGCRFSNLSYLTKNNLFFKLFSALFYDFRKQLARKKVTREYLDALIIFAQWLLAQSWYFVWDFYHLMNKIAISKDYKIFLTLHEMHFYSKVIWKVANERGVLGATAQHALIVPEKLWYFPEEAEVKANCPLPDIFFVYSDEIKELLQPLYPETKFFKCCSPRFTHWKSCLTISTNHRCHNNKPVILFVNNAAILHDAVVLRALRILTRQGLKDYFTLRLRLHPKEHLKLMEQLWVWAAAILHKIERSSKSLQEDFQEADLVIGANSTVVQEALLMEVSVMSVFDEYYITSSILPSSFICHIKKLTLDMLNYHISKKPSDILVRRLKTNIGVFSPDLTTKLIFDTLQVAGRHIIAHA